MLYRDIEVEKFWDIPSTTANKKEKINNAIMTGNYGASIKKDGEYIRAIHDTDEEIWIIGRGTNAKEVHNLDKHLVFITDWLKENFAPGTCILGELYVPGKTSRAIRAYTGSLVSKSLKNQKDCPPIFYIFDVWALDGHNLMNETYADRMLYLDGMKEICSRSPQIQYVEIATGGEVLDYIAEAFENDEEGCVLVDLSSKPAPGKRTAWKTIKVKKEFQSNLDCFFNGEFTVPTREYTGSEIQSWKYWENIHSGEKTNVNKYDEYILGRVWEPITKPYYMNWPGSLGVAVWKNKQAIRICYVSGLTDELKEQFINSRKKIIMRPIAITGMETTDASIRHPKFMGFRDDIPLPDCTYEKIFGE